MGSEKYTIQKHFISVHHLGKKKTTTVNSTTEEFLYGFPFRNLELCVGLQMQFV